MHAVDASLLHTSTCTMVNPMAVACCDFEIATARQHGIEAARVARARAGGARRRQLLFVLKRFLFDKKMLKKKTFANFTSGRRQSKNLKQASQNKKSQQQQDVPILRYPTHQFKLLPYDTPLQQHCPPAALESFFEIYS